MPPKDEDLTGKKVGEYDILSRIGAGGMGVVYEGLQAVIGKRVAVKVLLPQLSADPDIVDRFLSEARAVNAIRHRGIIDIFSFGQLPNGSHYFVMEYLEGDPFDKIIKHKAPITAYDVLCWTEEVLDALDAAHTSGIIHRDIKPSNLFLVNPARGRPYVKLLDFGIAKLGALKGDATPQTRASVIIGTPDYMSPEQARGRAISPATDLYALGCVLFELLTGKRVFRGENPMQTMFMHVENQPPKPSEHVPDLPPELDDLLLWTLEKDPANRPATASELKQHVEQLKPLVPNDTTKSFTALPRISRDGMSPVTPGPGSARSRRVGTPPPVSARRKRSQVIVGGDGQMPPQDSTRIMPGPTRAEEAHVPTPAGPEPLRGQVQTDPVAEAVPKVDPLAQTEEPLVVPKSPVPKIVLMLCGIAILGGGAGGYFAFRNDTSTPPIVVPPPPPSTHVDERRDDEKKQEADTEPTTAEPEKKTEEKVAAEQAAAEKKAAEEKKAEEKAAAEQAAAEKKAAAEQAAAEKKAAAEKRATTEKKVAAADKPKPRGKVYSAEDVAARIVALDQKLSAREAKTGSKDRVLRQFLDQAKAQASAAKTDEDRKEVWNFLSEVDKQLKP